MENENQEIFRQLASALQARRELAVFSVNLLLDGLRNNDEASIAMALRSLGVPDQDALGLRMNALNSAVHNLINDFKNSLDLTADGGLPRAASKLKEVIELSFQAADKTLSLCETQAYLLRDQRTELHKLEEVISALLPKDASGPAVEIIQSLQARLMTMLERNHNVVMAQSYQDLSGQAAQKVIELIQTIEQQLICLTTACSGDNGIQEIVESVRLGMVEKCSQREIDNLFEKPMPEFN